MYRDDPLDDELELRELLGDPAVDAIADGEGRCPGIVGRAVDVLRLLQGWVTDDQAVRWFTTAQRRLEERTPVAALGDGDADEVLDAARAWVAAQG